MDPFDALSIPGTSELDTLFQLCKYIVEFVLQLQG
jgi:hypothetical protein